MKMFLHKISHFFHCNRVLPDAFWDEDKLMMSFKCSSCGKRSIPFDTGKRILKN